MKQFLEKVIFQNQFPKESIVFENWNEILFLNYFFISSLHVLRIEMRSVWVQAEGRHMPSDGFRCSTSISSVWDINKIIFNSIEIISSEFHKYLSIELLKRKSKLVYRMIDRRLTYQCLHREVKSAVLAVKSYDRLIRWQLDVNVQTLVKVTHELVIAFRQTGANHSAGISHCQ